MTPSARRETYHHGDLRKALLTAALDAVERKGWESLTLSDLAGGASVAKSAPYRHFAGRRALLQAVAAEAFELLMAEFASTAELAAPADRLCSACTIFLRFARERPQLFRLLFRGDLLGRPGGSADELIEPARSGWLRFEQVVADAATGAPPDIVKSLAVTVWAMIFGFGVLTSEGRVRPFMQGSLAAADLEAALLASVLALVDRARPTGIAPSGAA